MIHYHFLNLIMMNLEIFQVNTLLFNLMIMTLVAKLRNLIFNPFSLDGRGKSYLTLNSNLDPDQNYYNTVINYIDACDYYNENAFKQMTKDPTNTEFSILHLNIPSIMNKFDDFKAYLNSLEHEFSVIGLSETWLNSCNENNLPLPNYSSTGMVRKN